MTIKKVNGIIAGQLETELVKPFYDKVKKQNQKISSIKKELDGVIRSDEEKFSEIYSCLAAQTNKIEKLNSGLSDHDIAAAFRTFSFWGNDDFREAVYFAVDVILTKDAKNRYSKSYIQEICNDHLARELGEVKHFEAVKMSFYNLMSDFKTHTNLDELRDTVKKQQIEINKLNNMHTKKTTGLMMWVKKLTSFLLKPKQV